MAGKQGDRAAHSRHGQMEEDAKDQLRAFGYVFPGDPGYADAIKRGSDRMVAKTTPHPTGAPQQSASPGDDYKTRRGRGG